MQVTDEREEGQPSEGVYVLPASFAQRRLWFLDQMEPGSPAYNIPAVLRLAGRLDVEALNRALEEIVRRHESLRTTFALEGEEPVQVIAPVLAVSLPLVDLSGLNDEAAREIQIRTRAEEEARTPFDLARGPLVRATLLRLSVEEHVLLLTMHHIISDGWSIGVLFRELSTLYGAFAEGRPSPLAELPIQYADYAEWQRGWLTGDTLAAQLAYWREQLAGAPTVLELPTDRPRPAVQSFNGAKHSVILPADLARRVAALSRGEGATLYMTLLAAFEALLTRYTGQKDLVVGMPIAGRTREELEGLVGFFVNTLALRTDLSGDPTFSELVGRVRQACLGAYANQDVPFEKLVEELQPERSLSHNPLYQVVFTYTDAPAEGLSLPGLKARVDEGLGNGSAKFDLNLIVIPRQSGGEVEGLRIVWEYNTDLFDAATIERMSGHYATLLAAAAADPARRISELPLLTEEERRRLLFDFGGGTAAYACDAPLHVMFAAQARRTPCATAVVFEGQRLTYSELDARAETLARRLRARGVRPGVLVAVGVERSLELVVALLGVLKAGGAYVPLDPAYPKDRVAFMLEDSKAAVLVTERGLLASLPAHPLTLVVDEETRDETFAVEAGTVATATADDLAYVIYTSGSTGTPKGVPVTHRNVARLFAATQDWFDFGAADVWTLFHSYAFDFSVWELWGALLYGGRLVVVPWEVSRNPEAFYRLLSSERVTVLNQTPSAFRQLVRAEGEAGTREELSLRLVIFGGEALEPRSLAPWFERHGDARPRLVNMYGITETTVHVTYRPLTEADVEGTGSPIGVPIPDLCVYLLDERRQPVPFGVPGEIYVGGAGVARGYLNRAELTAERFVADPFSQEAGARLYKSGDLARRLPDGSLEYSGRADRQVKIRGFRIELGEIEAALGRYQGVREALVLAKEEAGDRRLVAYVVAARGGQPTAADLRAHLKERLPEYMVPAAFAFLEEMPLTPNGKIDHRALPEPEQSRDEAGSDFAAPREGAEAKLAAMWEELLGVERVGRHDNFFDLGGHSILATILVSSVRKEFQLDLPLRTLFEASTVADLAAVIERTATVKSATARPSLVPVSRESHRVKARAD